MKKIEEGLFQKLEHDKEWAETWKIIKNLYKEVEKIEDLFKKLDVSYLREMQQKMLVLNMKKYIWTLKGYIINKFGENTDFEDIFQ